LNLNFSRLTNSTGETLDAFKLDEAPFLFSHDFQNLDVFQHENIKRILLELPESQIMSNNGNLNINTNFDNAHRENKIGTNLESLVDTLFESKQSERGYIMVNQPEKHPLIRPLFEEIKASVNAKIKAHNLGADILNPMLYLFIAGPNSMTPFHIDRYSTFLFQIRGSKNVHLYPAWNNNVIPHRVVENFVSWGNQRPQFHDGLLSLRQVFKFQPGQALHIPFLAGHDVMNGPDGVSISLSIIFNTAQSQALKSAMHLNHLVRSKIPFADKLIHAIHPSRKSFEQKEKLYNAIKYFRRK
jgi:hypothetical protein